MKKISFIRANKTKFGGAEVYLSRLSSALKKQNIDHEIINSGIPKFLPSWVRVALFNTKVCSSKKDKFYFSLERISCPDIYRAGDGVHKVFLGIEKKSKLNPLHKLYLHLEKKCFNNAKKIIANSNMVKRQIIDTYNIDQDKIEVVYNGINLIKPNFLKSFNKISKEFHIKRTHAAKANPASRQKIILYVGSGFKRKGVEEFLHILAKLKYKNYKAFIVGKDKRIKHYKNLAKELGVEKKVIFTGPRSDVNDFYTVSDIFLFPTRYEPFSNVILEAMNFSNAVFTTKQNGASEVLDEAFVMTDPKDYKISKKIDSLLFDREKLNKVKMENILKSREFSIEKNLENTMKVIDEVIH